MLIGVISQHFAGSLPIIQQKQKLLIQTSICSFPFYDVTR